MEPSGAIRRMAVAGVLWLVGAAIAGAVTFALLGLLPSPELPAKGVDQAAAARAASIAVGAGGAAVAVWYLWSAAAYGIVVRRNAVGLGVLQYWKKRERQGGVASAVTTAREVDRAYPFGALFPNSQPGDDPACHLWLPNVDLPPGRYDLVIIGTVRPWRRVILLLGDDVILPVWHAIRPARRHGRPVVGVAARELPAGWHRRPVLVTTAHPAVVAACLLVGGVVALAAAAWSAPTQIVVVPVVAAVLGWLLVAVGLVTLAGRARTQTGGAA